MITSHKQSKHMTIIKKNIPTNNNQTTYTFNQFEYVTDIESILTTHDQSKHMTSIKESIPINKQTSIYTCNNCEFVTDIESMLTTHEQSKHMESIEKRSYMCLFCDYETGQKDVLDIHVQNCD